MSALPYSVEAEQSVLGALMIDSEAMDRVSARLKPEAFFDSRHRSVYVALRQMSAASHALDVVSVFEKLRDSGDIAADLGYLNALVQSVPSATHVERHAAIVTEKAAQRALMAAADKAQEVAAANGTATEKLDTISGMFGALERDAVRKMPRRLSEVALERTAHYEALERGEVEPGWPTHIPKLDRMFTGGVRPGKLYILAARPSVGKSSLAMHLLLGQAKAGRASLFLSQEMESSELADRAVANTGRVQYGALLSGKLQNEGWERASNALDELSELDLWVDDESSMTLLGIKAKARSVKGLKVLVVDYLQLCASGLVGENRNSQIEELTRGLKALAKDMGIAIIALSQLNREVEKRNGKRPQLSDLRDSGAIEQDADAVIFLWPIREDGDSQIRSIGCDVAKNRQGGKGAFVLAFEGGVQHWGESTESLDSFQPAKRSGGYE
jgi:replicative DNA helicase